MCNLIRITLFARTITYFVSSGVIHLQCKLMGCLYTIQPCMCEPQLILRFQEPAHVAGLCRETAYTLALAQASWPVIYCSMLAYSCFAYLYFHSSYFSTTTYYTYAFRNNPFVHSSFLGTIGTLRILLDAYRQK